MYALPVVKVYLVGIMYVCVCVRLFAFSIFIFRIKDDCYDVVKLSLSRKEDYCLNLIGTELPIRPWLNNRASTPSKNLADIQIRELGFSINKEVISISLS